ncbi:hypothetical protein J8J04_02955 ['Fragaria x ananassa' phyllody phytoplasma]|uniref:Uncharacterized protein n=1 Tax='Fragaria x ananassa' phyllody phytoplasma TaxID=2358428 RepID=A0ABS5K3Z7_9MOLU|nr:hypothetical protein ['Fragaria x ananassa' phyllody phytoplasma]MBS2126627.1 hypothetical protein ['Fragaria x ananassa' phyllody phytoplasma]
MPQETLNDVKIDAIYFDDDIRIMSESPKKQLLRQHIENIQEIAQLPDTVEDLLKLSNGAKNIYLFTFNTQKRPIHINLPDNINPYEAIRDWKRSNNLYAYEGECNKQTQNGNNPITITEPAYKEIKIPYTLNLIENTFETEDKIYRITCQDAQPKSDILNTYQKDYVKWLEQCYIQYGCTVLFFFIRQLLFLKLFFKT